MKLIILVVVMLILFGTFFIEIKTKSSKMDKEYYEREIESLKASLRLNKIMLDNERRDAISISRRNSDLKMQVSMLKTENYNLMVAIKQYQVAQGLLRPKIPPSTVEAVKYAMKKAHPDNGGSTEDFMKFKECYDELTKK